MLENNISSVISGESSQIIFNAVKTIKRIIVTGGNRLAMVNGDSFKVNRNSFVVLILISIDRFVLSVFRKNLLEKNLYSVKNVQFG